MDRQTVIGFVLIAFVLIIWIYMNPIKQEVPTQQTPSEEKQAPSRSTERDGSDIEMEDEPTRGDITGAPIGDSTETSPFAVGPEETIRVTTSLYIAEFSTRGAAIRRMRLREFSTWNGFPVQLVEWKNATDFNLIFYNADTWQEIKVENLNFRKNFSGRDFTLRDSALLTLEFILPLKSDTNAFVKRSYTFRNGVNTIAHTIELKNLSGTLANEYDITFQSPPITEENSVDEASYASALTFLDEEMQDFTISGESDTARYSGYPHWISLRNKYFCNTLLADDENSISGIRIEGKEIPLPDEGLRKIYQAFVHVKYSGQRTDKTHFTLYMGPIEYSLLSDIHPGLESIVDLGWTWLVRPISIYFMLPLFRLLHSFIPNYGLVIVLFSLIIKVILYPLTKSSMNSMRKMQALQPMMTELREKYKDDQQKMNAEIMKLYQEYGVNPMGGCLPLLLQMPILYALFKIFGSVIDLRQASFILWITDLSTPDTIFDLPFKLPLFGMSQISGLAFLMGITMFIQQKQTVKDPRQKSMVYIMPIMFTLMFNGFPSGLNLYYFVFNLLSIAQQYYINKKHKNEPLQKVKKKKKKGWMQRYMESAQIKAKSVKR